MQDDSRKGAARQAEPFGGDTIEGRMRGRIRETIEAIVEEELEAALGAEKSARVGTTRQGYRHGTRERTLTTSLGPTTFGMPRARLVTAAGTTTEWRSTTVARYQRRTARVDEALLGVYLSRHEHATAEGRAGAAASRRSAVEGCDLAVGWPAARRLRDVAEPGFGRGGYPLSLSRWLVPESADRPASRARAGAGDAGRARGWPSGRPRPPACR